ncbi:hypothetical protein SAMN05216207_11191 [Pseudonocardia ammonioxydans]|uniref:Uncharacterized protein n=1 Tax=Pseudonocardia ammonioxydans TaxID=260086 RepID=A0A1I5IPI8_PSUAM|nr:hypothetical protein [Pseudonocardia ammonioxydans]SFO62525.1 hypothetical protein SAMN05216207_11191 [Pseudonocardia ammonioxydans]
MMAEKMPFPPFPLDVSLFISPVLESVLAAVRRAGFTVPTVDEVLTEVDEGVVQLVLPAGVRPRWHAAVALPRAALSVAGLLATAPSAWLARSDATLAGARPACGCRGPRIALR